MSGPTTDNKTADIINELVSAFMSGGEKAAEVYLTSLAPEILGIPVVQFLLDQLVQYLGQIISVAGQKFTTQIVIDLQINGEKSSVLTTAVALQYALASGDKNAVSLATKNLSQSYSNLFNYDGSSQPT